MRLIINADDFGLTESITDGIIDGIKAGVVTSTTLMANTQATEYAIAKAHENKIDCIGFHANFTLGRPLTRCPSVCDTGGNFLYIDKQIENNNADEKEVYNEAKAQLNFILDRGIKVSHIDSHHWIRKHPVIHKAIVRLAREHGFPVRNECDLPSDIKTTDVYEPGFQFEENVNVTKLREILSKYRDTNKTVELSCHVGYMDEYSKGITSYRPREKELQVLLEAKRKGVFNGIEMVSFKDI